MLQHDDLCEKVLCSCPFRANQRRIYTPDEISVLKAEMDRLAYVYDDIPITPTTPVEELRAAGNAWREAKRKYEWATRVRQTPQVGWGTRGPS